MSNDYYVCEQFESLVSWVPCTIVIQLFLATRNFLTIAEGKNQIITDSSVRANFYGRPIVQWSEMTSFLFGQSKSALEVVQGG